MHNSQKAPLLIVLEQEQKDRLAEFAWRKRSNMRAVIRLAIDDYLARHKPVPAGTERATQLLEQSRDRAHAEALRLAKRLRKYEPGSPMRTQGETP